MHEGAVVFADSSDTPPRSERENEVRSQMPVFAPAFNSTSARSAKTNVESVDPETVLDGVENLEITTWKFKHNGTGKHIEPMAEEFAKTFDLGDDDESISTVDAEGVALAAIQGLSKKLAKRDDWIAELEQRLTALEA
ncbi:tail fiber domain-containing protein [Halalkalicoccus tibetensis]|uniref:Tail fiber domain-containing protein n=1 Tax=Halalkalicoccus tibetensis TaxID=175632 RepID=A0ABD5VAA0_9EURY